MDESSNGDAPPELVKTLLGIRRRWKSSLHQCNSPKHKIAAYDQIASLLEENVNMVVGVPASAVATVEGMFETLNENKDILDRQHEKMMLLRQELRDIKTATRAFADRVDPDGRD